MSCPDEQLFLDAINGQLCESVKPSFFAHMHRCSVCRQIYAALLAEHPITHSENDLVRGRVGQKFGRYRVQRVIGRGASGTVYEAIHTKNGTRAALKCLHAKTDASTHNLQRFRREASLLRELAHPSIVSLLDCGLLKEGLQTYFVMEYLEGDSLQEAGKKGVVLSFAQLSQLFSQVSEALAYIHERGVIHRDLKPANLFMCDSAGASVEVKLIDFGLASLPLATNLTRSGMYLGTPAYAAPEQLLHGAKYAVTQSDLYALGVVAFELLSGVHPFPIQAYSRAPGLCDLHKKAPSLASCCPEIDWDASLEALLAALLSPTITQRPSDAKEVQEWFQYALLKQSNR